MCLASGVHVGVGLPHTVQCARFMELLRQIGMANWHALSSTSGAGAERVEERSVHLLLLMCRLCMTVNGHSPVQLCSGPAV